MAKYFCVLLLFLAACQPKPLKEQAWDACTKAVKTELGVSGAQKYNPDGVILNDTLKDGTKVDFSTWKGPRQYEVSVFYAKVRSTYHCVLIYDPGKETWALKKLSWR